MQNSDLTPTLTPEAVVALVVPAYGCLAHREGRSSPAKRRSDGSPEQRSTSGTRVLLLGRIRELALYRAEFLRRHGYGVATPETREDAMRVIRSGNFDIAVLSYTLPSKQVEEFAQLIREYCSHCPIIAIAEARRLDKEIDPDEIVIADDGPAALIAALRRVTRKQ